MIKYKKGKDVTLLDKRHCFKYCGGLMGCTKRTPLVRVRFYCDGCTSQTDAGDCWYLGRGCRCEDQGDVPKL